MFSVHCPRHGSEVLLSSNSIEALRNTERGVELHWRCRCGARGVEITGLAAPSVPALSSASPRPGERALRPAQRRPGTAA